MREDLIILDVHVRQVSFHNLHIVLGQKAIHHKTARLRFCITCRAYDELRLILVKMKPFNSLS